MTRRALALAALALVLAPAAAHAKRVRVFAVGPKLDLSWLDSRAEFRGKLLALMDRRQRTADSPPVQRDADDVASHLLGPADPANPVVTARDLVALPEDVGLFAVFTGQKGATARQASSITESIAAVLASYAVETAYYATRYPQLADRNPPTRLLALALTDTFGRVAVETFAELADRYDVWLEAGVNMAQSWRIVCTSKATYRPPPGGAPCDVENGATVATLRPPDEPMRDYVYEATTDRPSNMGLLFDPSGRLVAKAVKSYITPIELRGQLDLAPGPVSGLEAIDTPVGRLGIVTSRDAFTPNVTHLLDQRRVELLLQPEFYVNDLPQASGFWAPDGLKASGWAAVMRYPSIEHLVLPSMTGNIFEFAADAQQHFVDKPRSTRGETGGALVGQPRAAGFVSVDRYGVPDPLTSDEPFATRRRRIAEAAKKLPRDGDGAPCPQPDVPGPCTGGQVESVLFHDVQVGDPRALRAQPRRRRGRTRFSLNRPVASSQSPQRNAALAARGRTAWAVFEEHRAGHDHLVLARSVDDGTHWRRLRSPTGAGAAAGDEWWPAIAAGPRGRVWVAWSDDRDGRHRVRVARSDDGGRRFGPAIAIDPAQPEASQFKPAIVALRDGSAAVAWVSERDRQSDEPHLPEAGIWFARIGGDGATTKPQRIDAAQPKDQPSLDNSWSPSLAARGNRLLLAYMDSATADWRIWSRESSDRGDTWGAEQQVNDTPPVKTDPVLPPENEALNDAPAAAFTSRGPLVAFTDFRKHDASQAPHELYDTLVSVPGAGNRQVDPHGGQQIVTFWPAILPLPGGDALVAWQDHAQGSADIAVARVGPSRIGPAHRVDDSGRAGWNQWRPALARTSRAIVAAWEDDRDGPANIFVARARPARIR